MAHQLIALTDLSQDLDSSQLPVAQLLHLTHTHKNKTLKIITISSFIKGN